MIGFALIGTGTIAHQHAEAIKSLPGAKLLAIKSSDQKRAEAFAKQYNIPLATTDYNLILNNKDIHAVDIVTVNNTHADLGILAAEAGKHVLVEKPLDASEEKAQQLITACKKNKVILGVISQFRFDKALIQLKKLLTEEKLGKPLKGKVSMKWHRSEDYFNANQAWRKNATQAGGGVLMVQAIHHLDYLRYLLGEVKTVAATLHYKTGTSIEETADLQLTFQSGTIIDVHATTATPKTYADTFELTCEQATATLKRNKYYHSLRLSTQPLSFLKNLTHYKKGTIKDNILDFTTAIKENKHPAITGEDALQTLHLVYACYTAEKLKRSVEITSL
ncbi:MAG: Gfo/Idh/MocA family oxidoreductase [Candidatus Nanoarchaeia archaeon]